MNAKILVSLATVLISAFVLMVIADDHQEAWAQGADDQQEGTLQLEGDPGTQFSLSCTIGDGEFNSSGEVPKRYRFWLEEGQNLECEIEKQSAGTLKIVLEADGTHSVQQIRSSQGSTIELSYGGDGVFSSISSDSGAQVSSSSQSDSSSSSVVVVSSSSSSTGSE